MLVLQTIASYLSEHVPSCQGVSLEVPDKR